MKSSKYLFLFSLIFLFTSCYHAKITTDKEPSRKVIDKPFASGWIYGLVPPKEVKAAKECEAGVAIVETRLSFLNMLVAQLTGGLYTPMHIKVTCAEPSRTVSIEEDKDFKVAQNSSEEQLEKVFQQASDKAVDTQAPVLIKFQ